MNQFATILRFELKNYLKNKIFVGVTIFLVLVIAVVISFPRITALFESNPAEMDSMEIENAENNPVEIGNADGEDAGDLPVMLIAADTEENAALAKEAFAAAFPWYNVRITTENPDTVKEQIRTGDAECAFVLDGLASYTYYVNNLSMYDDNTYAADEVLRSVCQMRAMVSGGLSEDAAEEILSVQITHEVEKLGKDQMQNFFYTYIMIFALYMVILLYGQMVATNVASEKSSRAMELLITSAKPTAMMFGKVIASCLAGLIQLTAIFGSAFLFFNLNKADWADNMIINSIFDMPLDLLLYMLLFFVLGFFIYAFLYGAVGSTASKLEDINTSVMPITLLFIAAFFVVMFSMTSGNVDNVAMKICSYIPFTSPMAMFTRIAMSTVPTYGIVSSVAILIVSVFGVGVLSAKIYRVGVLLYGTTPKIGSILKSVLKS